MKGSSQHLDSTEKEPYGPATARESDGTSSSLEEAGPWTELSDRELLQLCVSNEHAAWELWCRHKAHLEHVVSALTRLPRWDVEEIMSTAALRFHRQVPRYATHIRNLQAWMSTLSRNVAMDYLRSAGRFQRQHSSLEEELVERPDWKFPSLERERLVNPAIREAVRFGIESLSARLRETARAHFLEEKSYKEISRAQRIRPGTARKRIQIARTHLREKVAEYLKNKSPFPTEQVEKQTISVETGQPAFEIECSPVSSRLVLLSGQDQKPRFHHLFFSHRLGREEQKLQSLQEYVQAHPRGWSKQLELAEINLSLGRWEEALAGYEICRRHGSAGLSVFLRPARLLQFLGMDPQARELCLEAMQGEHDPGSQFHLQAIMAETEGNNEQAWEMWQQARAAEPQNPAHTIAAAELQIRLGNSGKAARMLEDLLALEPSHLQAQNLLLEFLMDRGDYGAAYGYVKQLYGQGDRNAKVLQYSSDFRAKGVRKQAEEWNRLHPILASMIKESPGLWRFLDAQAVLWSVEGRWNLLERQIEKSISAYSDDPEVWRTGSVWLAKICHPRILPMVGDALALFPEDQGLLEAAAYISLQERHIPLFRDFFDLFSHLKNQSPRLLVAAAVGVSRLLSEHEAATELAFGATERAPEDPATWLCLGCTLVSRSRLDEALEALNESWTLVTVRPGNVLAPAVALYAGHALRLHGRSEEALKWYRICGDLAQALAKNYSHPSLYWRQLTQPENNASRNIFHDMEHAWKFQWRPFHLISYPAWNGSKKNRVAIHQDVTELHKITSNPSAQSEE